MKVQFTVPGHLPSRANLHQHWRKRHAMAQAQRLTARLLTHQFVSFKLLAAIRQAGGVVRFVRVSPAPLDDDNLSTACKSLRDGVADALGINDRDPRIAWRYDQRQGKPPCVEISIEAAVAAAAGTEPAA